MKQNKLWLFIAAALIIAGVLLLCGCPPSGRPTHTVDVCLTSGLLAGPYCPASAVAERKYYVDPEPGEPIPPADLCTVSALLPSENCKATEERAIAVILQEG